MLTLEESRARAVAPFSCANGVVCMPAGTMRGTYTWAPCTQGSAVQGAVLFTLRQILCLPLPAL